MVENSNLCPPAPEYVPTGIVIVYVPSGRGIPPYTGYQFTLGDYIKLEEVQGLPASDKSRVLSPESRAEPLNPDPVLALAPRPSPLAPRLCLVGAGS